MLKMKYLIICYEFEKILKKFCIKFVIEIRYFDKYIVVNLFILSR